MQAKRLHSICIKDVIRVVLYKLTHNWVAMSRYYNETRHSIIFNALCRCECAT